MKNKNGNGNIKLSEVSTRAPKHFDKRTTKMAMEPLLTELDELQNLMYAERKHSLLVVLQGMDASGKDGLIKDVCSSMNPQGVKVQSFKVPTEQEAEHDFLWRIHQHTPAKGMVQVFNRSHYEDVLVTRVHGLIDDKEAVRRMESINNFEKHLVANNTHILKFYLHVSEQEQMDRISERKTLPHKMWKYNGNDIKEIARREEYLKCYEDVFSHCNYVPWQILPADQNWYKSYIVAAAIRNMLKDMDMQYPAIPKEQLA
ncbi:MAG: polyphosphate kinase [Sphingobacteriales bacterium]|nr:MAG: polyphosphate kinase [Sphingobacteriales bacterium]